MLNRSFVVLIRVVFFIGFIWVFDLDFRSVVCWLRLFVIFCVSLCLFRSFERLMEVL